MEDSLAQANFMTPELYRLLGYEPEYDGPAADIAGLSGKANALNDQLNQVNQALLDFRFAKGKGAKRAVAERFGAKNKAQLSRRKAQLMLELEQSQKELSAAQSLPRRVVGLKKLDAPGDPTGSRNDLFRVAFDLENQELVRALKGDTPVDSTLAQTYKERERILRERLRRQLGPDYETSTAGIEALADFDREQSEAFEQHRQSVIRDFSGLTESRAAALSDLTGARMQQLMYPSTSQAQRALLLGQVASDRNAYVRAQREGRGQQLQASRAKYEAQRAEAEARADAIAGIGDSLSSVGQGLTGAGTGSWATGLRDKYGSLGLGKYLGEGA